MIDRLLLAIFIALSIGGLMIGFNLSTSGLKRIKKYELLKLKAYNDQGGKPTIGWGHLIKPNEPHLLHGEITREEATQLLKDDLKRTEDAINQYVKVRLTGNQYDALVSLVFNIGIYAFSNSTILKKINNGDPSASEEFKRWRMVDGKISRGLAARRNEERLLYLS